MATVKEKRDIYKNKVIGTGEVDKSHPRGDEEMEPVSYSFLPEAYYASMLESFSICGVVDLTAGPGELAKACISRRIPFYGLVMSEDHGSALRRRLTEWLQRCMATEGNTFYGSEWAKAYAQMNGNLKDNEQNDEEEQEVKKPKIGPKKQPKKKKADDESEGEGKAKKKPKKIASSSSDSKS